MERKKVLEHAINYLMIVYNSIKTRPEREPHDLDDLNECISLLTIIAIEDECCKSNTMKIIRVVSITSTIILTVLIVLVLSGVIQ